MKKMRTPVSDRAVEFILTRKPEDLGNLTGIIIAKAIGVSLPYLSRKFKKNQKITLKDFILREKIHTAVFILEKHSDIGVEELAGKLGFAVINRFIHAFNGYMGIDPLAYRDLKYHRISRSRDK